MKKNKIKLFVALRESLEREKADLEARLEEIKRALSNSGATAGTRRAGRRRSFKRARNEMSLKEAVTRVTRSKSRTKMEILAAIKKLGYRFTAKKPVNSLNTVLYSKRQFKNVGGKFSPA